MTQPARPSLEAIQAIRRSEAARKGVLTRTLGLPSLKEQARRRACAKKAKLDARRLRIAAFDTARAAQKAGVPRLTSQPSQKR